jgi:hypothetical protein
MKLHRLLFFVLLSFFFSWQEGNCQRSDSYYKKNPVWIAMMDDTTANYFAVIRAFDLFWEGKELPTEEEEVLGDKKHGSEKREKGFFGRIFSRKPDDAKLYALDYKKFKHWQKLTEPFVLDDGSIVPPSQRTEIWKQSQQSRQ